MKKGQTVNFVALIIVAAIGPFLVIGLLNLLVDVVLWAKPLILKVWKIVYEINY